MTTINLDIAASAIVAVGLIAFWTSMWLRWMFEGDVRNWIVAAMPDTWRAQTSKSDVLAMSADELTMFIAAESNMPVFLRGVLTCRLCASAWIAGAGVLFSIPLLGSLWLLPLVWACGAYLAHRIYKGT